MSDEPQPQPLPPQEVTASKRNDFQDFAITMGALINPMANAQAEAARAQSAAQVEMAKLHAANERLTANHTFTINLLGLGCLIAVVVFGIYTQNHDILKVAGGAVTGLIAGYGLAKRK